MDFKPKLGPKLGLKLGPKLGHKILSIELPPRNLIVLSKWRHGSSEGKWAAAALAETRIADGWRRPFKDGRQVTILSSSICVCVIAERKSANKEAQ